LEKQKNRALNTLGNLTFSGTLNGQLLDTSRMSGTTDDLFTNKLKAELDRSINKHLEAGRGMVAGSSWWQYHLIATQKLPLLSVITASLNTDKH
jgi:hypothetical protein